MSDFKGTIAPLNGKNYSTWKIQCRMTLIKDGLWSIVIGTETLPEGNAEAIRKFNTRRDKALAIIVLSVDTTLLYLLGNPEDPKAVWLKLEEQFQRKTWANRLYLRRKLLSLRLLEGGSVNDHIKEMTEVFEELCVVGDAVSDEDRVVYLLASLPDSFNVIVTALEAQSESVPKWELVTERLLHEEAKQQEKSVKPDSKALATSEDRSFHKKIRCHFCHKLGHMKKDCRKFHRWTKSKKQEANPTKVADNDVLVVTQALTSSCKGDWIIDSGATCHMSNDESFFVEMKKLSVPQNVMLGDGCSLKGIATGNVLLETLLPDGKTTHCTLSNVLLVPELSYSLLSVSKAASAGKITKFDKRGCEIMNAQKKVIGFATRVGNLYYLEHCHKPQSVNNASSNNQEKLWHRRFGHLGEQNLCRLARNKLVKSFDYNTRNSIGFCETCVKGRHHCTPFSSSKTKTTQPLELVHSDVCGKMSEKSLGGANYFVSFTDDKTRYSWIYTLKTKDQVFDRFVQWKTLVEKQTGHVVKILRSDNGGEYTSNKFKSFLKAEGIRHERTIPKTPEQNGVAERFNRTVVESARSMLLDAALPKSYWAEAISTATYLKNRSPSRAIHGKTPYEEWYGEKPNVDCFRVFGCEAYAHVSKDERQKLDSKAKKCVMLGYGDETKGYKLYDRTNKRVIYSRDVKFNEEPIQHLEPSEESDCSGVEISRPTETDSDEGDMPSEVHVEDAPAMEEETVQLRRSTRSRCQPDYYVQQCHITDTPSTYQSASTSSEKQEWRKAMKSEMKSLEDNDVWDLVNLPSGRKIVGSKWVFKKKIGPNGTVERFKARLVAQGYTQKFGTDYDETFCPVVRQESLRTILALSAKFDLKLHQVDVTTAFLNGSLKEEVFMRQPEGFECPGSENLVCKLKKSIYGLKQSPRCWNTTLDQYLKRCSFTQSKADPCIYFKDAGGENPCYIGVYVDDIIIAAKLDHQIQQVKDSLSQQFELKDLGQLKYFLGMSISRNVESGHILINQPAYIKRILEVFGMQDCKSVSTPISNTSKLEKSSVEDECIDQHKYQSAIGSLLYLAVCTRPDISYAVSTLAKFTLKPNNKHWTALKRIFRYLQGTKTLGLKYSRNSEISGIVGYSDADWAGDVAERRSTSGYMFLFNGGPISWKSQRQKCVALSTAEAEYVALSSAAQESIWLTQLLSELTRASETPMVIHEDNQSTIAMARNPQYHGRAKHIEIKHHFIRDQVAYGTIELVYCPSSQMIADMLTKGLNCDSLIYLRTQSGMFDNVK